jgi:hypothetical protein
MGQKVADGASRRSRRLVEGDRLFLDGDEYGHGHQKFRERCPGKRALGVAHFVNHRGVVECGPLYDTSGGGVDRPPGD